MEQMNSTTNSEPMNQMPQMNKKQPPYLWIAVAVIVAAGLGLMWYYMSSDLDFVPPSDVNVQQTPGAGANLEAEVNTIDTGDLDKEFQSIDSDLNSL